MFYTCFDLIKKIKISLGLPFKMFQTVVLSIQITVGQEIDKFVLSTMQKTTYSKN